MRLYWTNLMGKTNAKSQACDELPTFSHCCYISLTI